MLITCLQIPANTIFYPDTSHNYDLEKIQIALSECTEEELNDIIPIVVSHINSFVKLIRKQRKMI